MRWFPPRPTLASFHPRCEPFGAGVDVCPGLPYDLRAGNPLAKGSSLGLLPNNFATTENSGGSVLNFVSCTRRKWQGVVCRCGTIVIMHCLEPDILTKQWTWPLNSCK